MTRWYTSVSAEPLSTRVLDVVVRSSSAVKRSGAASA
jgi:hypothetical protein